MLSAPDTSTWTGTRALLLAGVQTGLRVSELTGLTINDIELNTGPHPHCHGKGRKDRCISLTRQTAEVLRDWLTERSGIGNVQVRAITSALRCPALKAITGMPLACAHSLMSRWRCRQALFGGSGRSRRVRSARS